MFVPDDCFGWFGQTILPKVLLSFVFISLPDDCCAGWLGQIIFPKLCLHLFHVSARVSLYHCFLTCFAGWLGQLILPKACFHLFLFVCQVIALPDGLARSCCHRFCLISIFFSHMTALLDGLAWLGQIIFPRVCLMCCRLWRGRLLCCMAWPGHFDKGVLSFFQWSRR